MGTSNSRQQEAEEEVVSSVSPPPSSSLQSSSSLFEHWLSKVQEKWLEIEYAPMELRANKQFMMKVLKSNNNDERKQQHGGGSRHKCLKFASDDLRNDMEVVLVAVEENGFALEWASPPLRNNKDLVRAAVESSGRALKFSSPQLLNDKGFILEVVQINGMNLEWASPNLRKDKDVVLAAVTNRGWALKFVSSPDLYNDKDVILAAVQSAGMMLEKASPLLKNDKQVVLAAVQQCGSALQFASRDKRQDLDIVLEAVKRKGGVLHYVPIEICNNKSIVLEAIKQDPYNMKYAGPKIKNDRDLLIAAGMLDDEDVVGKKNHHQNYDGIVTADITVDNNRSSETTTYGSRSCKKFALSTRYAIKPTSHSQATNFTALLKRHPYIMSGSFKVYAPNAFDKQSCDPNWTDYDWPCRGTKETCQFETPRKLGQPSNDSCWRYSFRYQIEESKSTQGFLLQVIEKENYWSRHTPQVLGKGQEIERHMAEEVGTKIFQVYRPLVNMSQKHGSQEYSFDTEHIDQIVSKIQQWYDEDCIDMSICVVGPKYDD